VTFVLAQVPEGFYRDRSESDAGCVANNGVCPDWIVDNLDRYVDPFLEHVWLVVASVACGLLIAFPLVRLARRVTPVTT